MRDKNEEYEENVRLYNEGFYSLCCLPNIELVLNVEREAPYAVGGQHQKCNWTLGK